MLIFKIVYTLHKTRHRARTVGSVKCCQVNCRQQKTPHICIVILGLVSGYDFLYSLEHSVVIGRSRRCSHHLTVFVGMMFM